MKRKTGCIAAIPVILVAGWVLVLDGIHPQFYDFEDVERIVITVVDMNPEDDWPSEAYRIPPHSRHWYQRVLQKPEEIKEFREALGVPWDGFLPMNSHEGYGPHYFVKIVKTNGNTKKLQFTNEEWGAAGITPDRMVSYMERTMK